MRVMESVTWTPEKIKQLRRIYGETQEQFADRVGVSPQALRYWEQGKGPPSGAPSRVLWFLSKYAPKRRELQLA